MMDQVYIQSVCNISATDARDSSEGLFRNRYPQHLNPAHVDLCVNDVECSTQYINCTVFDPDLLSRNISRTAAGRRGW
jgi:hypothetical protein